MPYPASSYPEGVDLTIIAGNQLHEVINGEANEVVTTAGGDIPTVRKALADSSLFKPAEEWNSGSNETDPFQTRTFEGVLYWAPSATTVNSVSMGATPIGDDNWFLAPVNFNKDEIIDITDKRFPANGVVYQGIGNISEVAGEELSEEDKLNAYEYPDDSGQYYGADQSQTFPITIPADPTAPGSGWSPVNSATTDYVNNSDSLVANGLIFPHYLYLGSQEKLVPSGTSRLKINTGSGFDDNKLIYLWGPSGDFAGIEQTITNIQYDAQTDRYLVTTLLGTYAFVTFDNLTARKAASASGYDFYSVTDMLNSPITDGLPNASCVTQANINGFEVRSKWIVRDTNPENTYSVASNVLPVWFELVIDNYFYFEELGFGDEGDQTGNWLIAAIISADKKAELRFLQDEYEVTDAVLVPGMNINPQDVKFISPTGTCFTSPTPTQHALTLVGGTKINQGQYYIDLDPTSADLVDVGDCILSVSTQLITRRWTDDLVRPSYLEGELHKIVRKVGGRVYLQDRIIFDIDESDIAILTGFTPNGKFTWGDGAEIETEDVVAANRGMNVRFFEDASIGDITTRGFALAGVRVNQCYNCKIGDVVSYGGDFGLGLAYGLEVSDGSRNCIANSVRGYDCRHAVSVTTTGNGCPVAFQCPLIIHSSEAIPENDELHGPDMHAASAYCTFGDIYSDRSISVSGMGHKVGSLNSSGGRLFLCQEGGIDIDYGDSTYIDPVNGFNAEPLLESTISSLTIRFKRPKPDFNYSFRLQDCTVKTLKIINEFVKDASSGAVAALSITPGNFVSLTDSVTGNNNKYGDVYIYGMPGVRLQYGYVEVESLTLVDCGWNESILTTLTAALHWISADSSYSSVGKLRYEYQNSNLSYNTTRGVYVGAGVVSARLENVSEKTAPGRTASFVADSAASARVNNFQISGFSPANGTLYYTNVRGIADDTSIPL